MLNSKSFLCLDFGAGSLKIAEFEPNEDGSLQLKHYAVKSLGAEGSQDASREAALLQGIKDVLAEKSFSSRQANICAPGFHVFSKFVKLPPVDTAKVTQIIHYEAQQNVPFPLEDVVWDYQILGATASGELEVLLVAIKADVVEGLFRTSETAGLSLHLVDVSPAALCNAFRYNYGDLEGCTMLLDIGAKTSNLLFFEKGKVYSRSINIGANSITQDFAAEARLSFGEADKIKIDVGFVSLGGAYEEPDNPHQAQISKIARQVMTRLHIQMNQTIQFYRGQQGGSAPQRLYLAGGASLMPYTAQFFAEKLNMPVEYFNPLRNIQVDPAISVEEIAQVAHMFGEVVGLGLRNLAQCPVELNLMPKSYLSRKQFNQKKPYFIGAVFSLVLVVFFVGAFYHHIAGLKKELADKLNDQKAPLDQASQELTEATLDRDNFTKAVNQYTLLEEEKFYWTDLILTLHRIFTKVEADSAQGPGFEQGIWIEEFKPLVPGGGMAGPVKDAKKDGARVGLPTKAGSSPSAAVNAGKIDKVYMKIRAVNLNKSSPSANSAFAYKLEAELKTNAVFNAKGTTLGQLDDADEKPLTFTFGMTLQLAKPIKLN